MILITTKLKLNQIYPVPPSNDEIVDLSSEQDIEGDKTFHHTIKINADSGYNTGLALINISSKRNQRMISGYVGDMTSIIGSVYWNKNFTTNNNRVGFRATRDDGGSYADLYVSINPDGTPVTYAPTPATSDNSTKIATTAYVKSNLSSYVDLSSIQNISGSKTFTNALTIKTRGSNAGSELIISNPDIVKGTVPSGTKYANIGFYGDAISSYSDRVGLVECQYNSDKSINVRLMAYNSTSSGNTNACAISCNVDSNGNIYTYAPTPATNDSSNKIATTAWVINRLNTYYKDLGDNYVMNYADFDKCGVHYHISSLSTATTINYPSGNNNGDWTMLCLRTGNFTTLIGVTPRSTKLFYAKFWGGNFNGWCVFDPVSVSS